jgi:predicted transcriptional regulator of viral defense system
MQILTKARARRGDDPASAQRLGFLLEEGGHRSLVAAVRRWLAGHPHRYCLLVPGAPPEGERNETWKLVVNVAVERFLPGAAA